MKRNQGVGPLFTRKPATKMNFAYLADHEEAISTVARWYFNEWGDRADENSVEERIQKLQKYLNRDKIPLMLLAMEGKEIVGVAQLKYYEMDIYPDKEYWIGGIFVPAEYRGNNIAARLIEKATTVARSLGVKTLYLQTERLDGGLYQRLGWQPIEQVRYKGLDVMVMEKQLNV